MLTWRGHDFLLARQERGTAAAVARFTAEDDQMRALLAGVHKATTDAELATWCQAHPGVPARHALAELRRQGDAFHQAGEFERRDSIERRREVLQSWRKGDRLIPPTQDDAVRSATMRVATCLNTWNESGGPAALAEAIEFGERARTEPVFAEADAADRSFLVCNLALAYARRRHTRTHDDDLQRAVGLLEEAAEIAPERSEARSTALLNLGAVLRAAGAALGEPDKLRRSREILAQLIAEMDVADPDRPITLWNLADTLDDLALHDPERQDEAIAMGEHALIVTPARSRYAPARIDGLGVMLRHRALRFRRASASADLRRTATLQRRAAALLTDGSLDQAEMLVHQANALVDLYVFTADEDSLRQSVTVYEQALHCASATPSLRASAFAGRGDAFLLRYRRRRTPDDLRAAREMIEKSLALDPRADAGNRLRRLAALAMAMHAVGDASLQDGAITDLQDALAAAGPHDPSLPAARVQLASLLSPATRCTDQRPTPRPLQSFSLPSDQRKRSAHQHWMCEGGSALSVTGASTIAAISTRRSSS